MSLQDSQSKESVDLQTSLSHDYSSEIKKVYSKFNMENNLKLIWFKGFHETVPQLVIPVLNSFVQSK